MITQTTVTQLGYEIIGCAIEVHRHLGPGLLESIYQECLIKEFREKGLNFKSQVPVPIIYKEELLQHSFRLDLLVENTVIVELKTVDYILPIHHAQLLSYMKLSKKPKGLLINFKAETIQKQAVSLINEYFAALPKSA